MVAVIARGKGSSVPHGLPMALDVLPLTGGRPKRYPHLKLKESLIISQKFQKIQKAKILKPLPCIPKASKASKDSIAAYYI